MAKKYFKIDDFSRGVNNTNQYSSGYYFTGSQLDHWTQKGKLSILPGLQALEHESSAIIDSSNGIVAVTPFKAEDVLLSFWSKPSGVGSYDRFFGEGLNNITEVTTFGTSSIEATASAGEYFNRAIFVEGNGIVDVTGKSTVTPTNTYGVGGVIDIWADTTLNNTYKPHQVSAIDRHYVTAGRYVASVFGDPITAGNWDVTAFDLSSGWEARCLAPYSNQYLAIASNYKAGQTNVSPSQNKISIWNGVSTTSDKQISVPEMNIQAIYSLNGYLWIWAGPSCNLYVNPIGSDLVYLVYRFQNILTGNSKSNFVVNPHAVTHKDNRIFFGLSNVDSTSASYNPGGVYSFNADPSNFDLGLAYQSKTNLSQVHSLVTYQTQGRDLLVFSEDGGDGTFVLRQKVIDDTNTFSSSGFSNTSFKSGQIDAPAGFKIRVSGFGVNLETAPSGFNLSVTVKNENGDEVTESLVTGGQRFGIAHRAVEGRSISLEAFFSHSGTVYPFIKNFFIEYDLVPDNR